MTGAFSFNPVTFIYINFKLHLYFFSSRLLVKWMCYNRDVLMLLMLLLLFAIKKHDFLKKTAPFLIENALPKKSKIITFLGS